MTNFCFSQRNILGHKIIESEGKYGIIPDERSNQKAIIQFDSIPIQLGGQFSRYYCVKKNGMWGVVYVSSDFDSIIEVSPYLYSNVQSIRNDFRSELLFLYSRGATNQLLYGIGWMYLSTENTILKLNTYSRKKGSIITFIPQINGKEIICDKEYEYLFAPAWTYQVLAKIEKKNIQDVTRYFRNEAEGKNDRYSYNDDVGYNCVKPKERGAKSLIIYDKYKFEDSLSVVYEFIEEPDVIYNILLPEGAWCRRFYEKNKYYYYRGLHHVLKTTLLKNQKYKHEFFEFNGKKVYEVISKNLITFWTPEEQIFYGDGKRICRFNPKKEKFCK